MENSNGKACTKCGITKEFSMFSKSGKCFKSRCKNCEAARVREYVKKNLELVKERKRKSWAANKNLEAHNERSRAYKARNPQKVKDSANKYARNNKKKIQKYYKERYHTDAEFNMSMKIRARIRKSLRLIGRGRKDRTINILGCDFKYFKKYLESKFTDGMSMDMVLSGKIHLDHIRPCASFDLLDPEEIKICFHYSNIQPLWAEDNMNKKDKLTWQKIV